MCTDILTCGCVDMDKSQINAAIGVSKADNGQGNLFDPMIDGVRWSEKHGDKIEKLWQYLPNWMSKTLVTVAVFLVASSIRGEWILIVVHALKHFDYLSSNDTAWSTLASSDGSLFGIANRNGSVAFFITASLIGSYTLYFGIGGFLHWYFYVRQRDESHKWKCQPTKFLSADVERHEIMLGSVSLFCVSVLTGFIAWYAANDGAYLTVYYKFDEYGWTWFFLQIPITFMIQDYYAYLIHRLYHIPWLYKRFHKMHHKYTCPTAFSVTAIHPLEMIHMQLGLASPIVFLPVHWIPFQVLLLYTYYHGIIDHSGIAFKAYWWQPWQPDAIFHDNHHQYFHVNFGFNMSLWDKLHGTYRQKNRVYSEHIFYGKGKSLDEVSATELANDLAQRRSENPNAYRSKCNENELPPNVVNTNFIYSRYSKKAQNC